MSLKSSGHGGFESKISERERDKLLDRAEKDGRDSGSEREREWEIIKKMNKNIKERIFK